MSGAAGVSERPESEAATELGFFEPEGERYIPGPHACSPWSQDLVHGRLVGGLMARSAENSVRGPGFHPARTTIDLVRPIPMEPITISIERRRTGKRLLLVEAKALVNDTVVGAATVLFLAKGKHPQTKPWSPEPWSVPMPQDLPAPTHLASRFGELRRVGSKSSNAPNRAWFRDTRRLIIGEDASPFTRVAAAADWVSPLANASDKSLAFINADITLYLNRMPSASWIGFETVGHDGDDGISISRCSLYDVEGRIGLAAAAALPYPNADP